MCVCHRITRKPMPNSFLGRTQLLMINQLQLIYHYQLASVDQRNYEPLQHPQHQHISHLFLFNVLSASSDIDCGDPGMLKNGQRTLSSTLYTDEVTYTCFQGYQLQGSDRRTCQSNRQWSGSVPQCNGMWYVWYVHSYKLVPIRSPRNYSYMVRV